MSEQGIKNEVSEATREEIDFCLNHCAHSNAKDCRWVPKQCMEEASKNGMHKQSAYGEFTHALLEKDWSNYSIEEIATELGADSSTIRGIISKQKKCGHIIPHADGRKQRKKEK